MSDLFTELKRRHVFRVGVAYAAIAWAIAQVLDLAAESFDAPGWFMRMVLALLLAGLPLALFLAWAFELTPQGVKRAEDVTAEDAAAPRRKFGLPAITGIALVCALGFIAWDELGPTYDQHEHVVAGDKSVAVLPFEDLSETGDQQWFVDGLTEEILNALARVPELRVTARTSSFEYRNSTLSIREIAGRLGVAHVVQGSVRRIGDQLRVTAQLIRANDETQLWSHAYDATTADLFKVQEDVAADIADSLDVLLDDEARERMFAAGTRNVEAFQAFLEGRKILNDAHSAAPEANLNLAAANEHFERALALDPEFVQAAILHADRYAHFLLNRHATIIGRNDELDEESAKEALRADYDLAVRYARDPVARVIAKLNAEFFDDHWYRFPALLDELETLVDAGREPPGDQPWVSPILLVNGRIELAERLALDVRERDPLSVEAIEDLADVRLIQGDLTAVHGLLEEERRLTGDGRSAIARAAVLGLREGNLDAVLRAISSVDTVGGDDGAFPPELRALRLALAGDAAGAEKLLDEIVETRQSPVIVAIVLRQIGMAERIPAYIRAIDATPIGPAKLANAYAFSGGLAFDLENAPNFAARLAEAKIDPATLVRIEPLQAAPKLGSE